MMGRGIYITAPFNNSAQSMVVFFFAAVNQLADLFTSTHHSRGHHVCQSGQVKKKVRTGRFRPILYVSVITGILIEGSKKSNH